MHTVMRWVAMALSMAAMTPVQAGLIDRGNGLIYDTELAITWLSDANYAATDLSVSRVDSLVGNVINGRAVGKYYFAGYDAQDFDGRMLWWAAMAWTQSLTYNGITGWRLPTTLQLDASCDLQFVAATTNGFPPVPASGGHNCIGSELGYMYHTNLGAVAHGNILSGTETGNIALFTNLAQFPNAYGLHSYEYWTGTLDASYHDTGTNDASVWYFDAGDGWQGYGAAGSFMNAWAVHDGDVGRPVPEPTTFSLFSLCIAAALLTLRKRAVVAHDCKS